MDTNMGTDTVMDMDMGLTMDMGMGMITVVAMDTGVDPGAGTSTSVATSMESVTRRGETVMGPPAAPAAVTLTRFLDETNCQVAVYPHILKIICILAKERSSCRNTLSLM